MQTTFLRNKQFIDHYPSSTSIITSYYGVFTIEICTPNTFNQPSNRIQTDSIELDCSKISREYILKIQHQKPPKSKLNFFNFHNDVFSIIYSYVSILETKESFYLSPPPTSRHAIIKREVDLFSRILNLFHALVTNIETSEIVTVSLQRIQEGFIVDYFQYNLNLSHKQEKSLEHTKQPNKTSR